VKAVIIGGGPAGLTAGFELLKRTSIVPVVLEKSDHLGGISRTYRHHGNRMDLGGHRFFSRSDRVMNWWLEVMPLEGSGSHNISYQRQTRNATGQGLDPATEDRVMLIRNRKSRIFFLRQFFDYPISLSSETIRKLGPARILRIGLSYLRSALFQTRPEKTLEQFFINRFGRELYLTFFKSYTEKVWGVPCDQISAEWGAQRIKGLSVVTAIKHLLKKPASGDISQKGLETSLIEKFMYPKLGPGQLWEYVAEDIQSRGGSVENCWVVDKLHTDGCRITSAEAVHTETGARRTIDADYFFSTMPVRELIHALQTAVPANVKQVADGLIYRDFITVGLLLKKLKVNEGGKLLADNWIYIQEPDVAVGRMQIFNNWSPYLVADPDTVWIGLEYFCYETDPIWKLSDADMIALARAEVAKMGIIDQADVLDACVLRVPKAYPAYFGAYERFDEVREYIDRFENLFLVGRNGMHKYNNQDHSMLTAMTSVDNIIAGRTDKANLWALNTEMEYHEDTESSL
jgi:protoporphyrinogen oxidase